ATLRSRRRAVMAEPTRPEPMTCARSITISLQLRTGCRADAIVPAHLTELTWFGRTTRERRVLVRPALLSLLAVLAVCAAGCGDTRHAVALKRPHRPRPHAKQKP